VLGIVPWADVPVVSGIPARDQMHRTRVRPPGRLVRYHRGLGAFVATTVVLVAIAFLCYGPVTASAEAHGSSFSDVAESLPAHDAIEYLVGAGVISGFKDGSFGPGELLKRGQATKVLVLWKGIPVAETGPSFTDLDDAYRAYVQTAAATGWISGFGDGSFRPYSTLSRQQMAIIMVRAMGWDEEAQDLSHGEIEAALAPFADRGEVASVARPYLALAVKRGLFGGSDGRLAPKDGITRAQFSLVVFRAELSTLATVQAVRFGTDHPDKTRVVVDLTRAPGAIKASITADGALNVDYADGGIGGVLTQAAESTEIKNLTARQLAYNPRTVRLTVNLARYQTFRVMALAPSEGKGWRIVVDVFRRIDGPAGDGPPLICVDPGHGGSDSGAVGVAGTYEKDVNLAIALQLAGNLRDAGLRVVMTREDDTLPTLQQRADIANAALASLFVSVHNNAAGDANAKGTETYYWGTPEEYSAEGKLLAEAIQRCLLMACGSVDRGARTHWRNLVVLSETDMTAALAEVGFLTNAEEEAKLIDPAYQKLGAGAIANGVLEYLKWSTVVYTSE